MPTPLLQTPLKKIAKPKKIASAEWKRLQALHRYEIIARSQGFFQIAGIDEAGRGPLAGPVVAAACMIPEGEYLVGVDDSKKLTAERRNALFLEIISNKNIHYAVGIVSHEEIDLINIYQATIKAMMIAVANLIVQPDYLFVDGMALKHPSIPCQKIIKGDQLSHSIAAASVIAKETRDRLMIEEHAKYPQYRFDKNKGYGTPELIAAIKKHGPSPIQRLTFKADLYTVTKDQKDQEN